MQIIVAAYNRPTALHQMLQSLHKATKQGTISLTVSIDFSDKQAEVYKVANDFAWNFGTKNMIQMDTHLGLKKHILNLIAQINNDTLSIIFEDDLYIADNYHQYITEAYSYYHTDKYICGISLYHQPYHQLTELPLWPLFDGSDVYFMQYPSSSGFVLFPWAAKEFLIWIENKSDEYLYTLALPEKIANWPESSWKKWLCAWMVEENKYMVYPRASFSTNTGIAGGHHSKNSNQFQSNLWVGFEGHARFKSFAESDAIYDSYMEHIPIDNISFDIYGQKKSEHIITEKVLTSQNISTVESRYALDLKPPELNYINRIEGSGLNLVNSSEKKIYNTVPQHLVNYFIPQSSPGMWLKNWIRNKI
ncbi:MAG: hypothetical protein SGJ10_13925 [Bacteroidota bacterium]|nr:hypothetical protein [Bacteroidota bacterium]